MFPDLVFRGLSITTVRSYNGLEDVQQYGQSLSDSCHLLALNLHLYPPIAHRRLLSKHDVWPGIRYLLTPRL